MAENLINLGISPEVIKPIVDTHIKALIVDALGGTQDLVSKAVEGFLMTKVNKDNGRVDGSNYNTTTLFNYYFNTLMAESVRESIKEILMENKDQIKEAVKKSLIRKKGDRFADAVVDCIMGTFDNNWHSNVKIELSKRDDR